MMILLPIRSRHRRSWNKMKEDPNSRHGRDSQAVDDTYSGLTGTIFTNDSDDEDISNSYDDAVVEALRTLKDGESLRRAG